MTPDPGAKPSLRARAMPKGRDRVLARTGMIGKGPRLPPNTLLGGSTILEEAIAGVITHSSIALMITCMQQAVTRPQCGMEGGVAM